MRLFFILVVSIIVACSAGEKGIVYQGSTPADLTVRKFLGISLTDSIDFIKWQLVIHSANYELNCQYGLSKAGTNGFTNGREARFSGGLRKNDGYYDLRHGEKTLSILEVNSNVLHLLDANRKFLIGNGGYSYALNSSTPVKSDKFNNPFNQGSAENEMAFQGRTPCRELSALLGDKSNTACIKMKWLVFLYTDPATGQPSHYLEGGGGKKKEAMPRRKWEIIRKNEKIIYKLEMDRNRKPLYLLKGDNNILFFVDPQGNLLVGNEDFSYTLNRARERESKL
jgi:hypothetical protein